MLSRVSKVALAAVVWVLSSCATQVYLDRWEPSQVDIPRGTVLHVEPEARGRCAMSCAVHSTSRLLLMVITRCKAQAPAPCCVCTVCM